MPSPAWTSAGSRRSNARGGRSGAGRVATTTSAGSVPPGRVARGPIHGEAARSERARGHRGGNPAEIPALRAPGILGHGPPTCRLHVLRSALQTPHAVDVDDVVVVSHVSQRRTERSKLAR